MSLRITKWSGCAAMWIGAGLVIWATGLTGAAQTETDRRIAALEALRPDARLTAIEARLENVEYFGRWILGAIGAQIVASGLVLKRSRSNE
jgi:hypothetical protein